MVFSFINDIVYKMIYFFTFIINQQLKTMSSEQTQTTKQSAKVPMLLKSLLGKVHFTAREIGNPETFTGCVFYRADKINKGRPDSYHIVLNNSSELTESQISRIVAIINESRPADQQFVVEQPARKQRNYSRNAKTLPVVMNQSVEGATSA